MRGFNSIYVKGGVILGYIYLALATVSEVNTSTIL